MDKPETTRPEKVLPYAKPRLHVYGDVRDITLAVGSSTQKNDGGHGNDKTA